MNLKKLGSRVLVAMFGAPLIIYLVLKGGWPFVILVAIINVVAQFEFYKLNELKGAWPFKILGAICTIFITVFFYRYGIENSWIIFLAFFYIILHLELFRQKDSATLNIATSAWGLFYPAYFFSFHILIRELPRSVAVDYSYGGKWILIMLITIWICDTAAYFVGSLAGKHKLYERISPHKTVEGAIAGFIFALITAYVFHVTLLKDLSLLHCMAIGLIAGAFSQIGDLAESVFKRDVGVKDTSSILPGHGGFLDRFDAPLFVAPLVYLYLRFVVY
ncbi:MAG: phosphatidate cytidylyltransferase [Candidatus Zhuqueibacterota bacterium]